LDCDPSFVWTLTVELEGEGVRAAVPTDFKAAFEADSLENIVDFRKMRRRGWLGIQACETQ
jgi:hypothetical protein